MDGLQPFCFYIRVYCSTAYGHMWNLYKMFGENGKKKKKNISHNLFWEGGNIVVWVWLHVYIF